MRKLLCLLAAGLLVFGVACGGGDEENEPAATEEESTDEESTDEETPEEESDDAGSSELEFTGTEFAFAGPESAPAGELSITFTNNGEQPHVMVGFPLSADAPPVEELAKLPEKEVQKFALGPLAGAGLKKPVMPGDSESFTVDTTDAASFAYICYIEDPKTKKPHLQLGMVGQLTIE
jgi:hypothetical protein